MPRRPPPPPPGSDMRDPYVLVDARENGWSGGRMMPRRTRPGLRGWLDLTCVIVLRHVARRLPVDLKKAVLADAWRVAVHKAGAPVEDATSLYLAYEQESVR